MKIKLLLLAGIVLLASCAPTEDANPLDRPYDQLSARELHDGNLEIITSIPFYRSRK